MNFADGSQFAKIFSANILHLYIHLGAFIYTMFGIDVKNHLHCPIY